MASNEDVKNGREVKDTQAAILELLKDSNKYRERQKTLIEEELRLLEEKAKTVKTLAEQEEAAVSIQEKKNELKQIEISLAQENLDKEVEKLTSLREQQRLDEEAIKNAESIHQHDIERIANRAQEINKQKKIVQGGTQQLSQAKIALKISNELSSNQRSAKKDSEESAKSAVKLFGLKTDAFDNTFIGKMMQRKKAGVSISTQIKDMGSAFVKALHPMNLATQALQTVFVSTAKMVVEQDKVTSEFNKTHGAAGKYDDIIGDVGQNHLDLGVDMAAAGRALSDLKDTFAGFTTLTKGTQKELTTFSATLSSFGVSSKDTAQTMDVFMQALGMTATQAIQAQKEVIGLATAMNVSVGKMMSDLAKFSTEFAAHGKNVEKVFKNLAIQSKRTGIEFGTLAQFAKKFDTFEGAADIVGKLSGTLGNVALDTRSLMMADEGDRIRMIADAVRSAGGGFASLTQEQQKWKAKSVALTTGLNEADAMKLLKGETEGVIEAQQAKAASDKEMADMAKKATDIGTKFVHVLNQLAVATKPLIDGIRWVADGLLYVNKVVGNWLIPALGALLIIYGLSRIAILKTTFAKIASFAASLLKIKLNWGEAASATARNEAEKEGEETQKKSNAGMIKSIPTMLAFGAAILLIGAGIALVTIGIAQMANAIKGMTTGEMVFLGLMLVGIGVGLYFLIPALMAFGATAGVTALPLLALGAAVLLIGGGIALVGLGIKLMADSVIKMLPVLSKFTGTMLVMGLAGISASLGLVALSFGLFALGMSLLFIKTADLVALGTIFTSLAAFAKMSASNLLGVASSVREITKAIGEIPLLNALGFVFMMDSTSKAATKLAEAEGGTAAFTELIQSSNMLETRAVENVQKLVEHAKTYREVQNNTTAASLDPLVSLLKSAVGANRSSGGGGSQTVILQLDGKTLDRHIIKVMDKEHSVRRK
jgi:hypothetical protein